jgi:hypothetical protein
VTLAAMAVTTVKTTMAATAVVMTTTITVAADATDPGSTWMAMHQTKAPRMAGLSFARCKCACAQGNGRGLRRRYPYGSQPLRG